MSKYNSFGDENETKNKLSYKSKSVISNDRFRGYERVI